eukprot:jgi/Ulvmu1/3448/UM016_0068.1
MVQHDSTPSAVTLTEDGTEDGSGTRNHSVILGHRIREEVAQRSELLAGISETQGLASLPANLSLEEVELRQPACLAETQLPAAEMAAVARSGAPPQQPPPPRPPCMPRLQRKTLDVLLCLFPFSLHSHLISAAAAQGRLTVPAAGANSFLVLLAAGPPTSSPLTSLTLPASFGGLPPATTALLAHALAANASLATLNTAACLPPAHLRQPGGILRPSSLPNLTRLDIYAHLHPHGHIALATVLKQLPSLERASIARTCAGVADSQTLMLAAYSRAVTAPAKLPRLQDLYLSEAACANAQQRTLGSQAAARWCVHLVLPLIHAPALTAVTLKSDASAIDCSALMKPLCRLPSLNLLAINTDALFGDVKGLEVVRYASHSGSCAVMPRLEALELHSAATVAPVIVDGRGGNRRAGALHANAPIHAPCACQPSTPKLRKRRLQAWGGGCVGGAVGRAAGLLLAAPPCRRLFHA